MAAGYNYPNDSVEISNFLAPAYLISALGIDLKPNNYISIFGAPLTGKFTIVNDQELADSGAFGVYPATFDNNGNLIKHGKKLKSEIGGYIRFIFTRNDFEAEFLKNVSFTTKLDLFSNYLNNPQNIDINWENQIAIKINKYISINFNTHLIYDDDIDIRIDNNNDETGPRIQFKEILGIGFSLNF